MALVFALIGAGQPTAVIGATGTSRAAACDGVRLRTTATTGSTIRRTIRAGTRVTVAGTVGGGRWRATCAGASVSGSRWYRITSVDGRSVSSLYGSTAVYAASGLFRSVRTATTTATPTLERSVFLPRPSFATEGIDVSHWQGVIDWPKVRDAGKRFAYIKASDGIDFVDDRYTINRSGANAAGLVVGAYHFARPDATAGDAIAEADHFVDTGAFASGDLLPVLDLERAGGLSDAALQAWVKAFLGRIQERSGVRAIIYVSPNFWKTYMGDTTWFATNGYQLLWVAHWTTQSSPTVPARDWASHGWTFWQYTSNGSVPGITGRVDLDRYRGTDLTKVRIP